MSQSEMDAKEAMIAQAEAANSAAIDPAPVPKAAPKKQAAVAKVS